MCKARLHAGYRGASSRKGAFKALSPLGDPAQTKPFSLRLSGVDGRRGAVGTRAGVVCVLAAARDIRPSREGPHWSCPR